MYKHLEKMVSLLQPFFGIFKIHPNRNNNTLGPLRTLRETCPDSIEVGDDLEIWQAKIDTVECKTFSDLSKVAFNIRASRP